MTAGLTLLDVLCGLVGAVGGFAIGVLAVGVMPWIIADHQRRTARKRPSPRPVTTPAPKSTIPPRAAAAAATSRATPDPDVARSLQRLAIYEREFELMMDPKAAPAAREIAALVAARVEMQLHGGVKEP